MQTTFGPELFIGLVGAVGTDLKGGVVPALDAALSKAGYETHVVRLSELIRQSACFEQPGEGSAEDARVDAHMEAGDHLRQKLGRGDAVALLALARIRALRSEAGGAADEPRSRHAYILDSLKHPAEIETLRRIYGQNFFALSAYTPRAERKQRLSRLIARSRGAYDAAGYEAAAERLIEKDQKAAGTDLGQNVRDTFPRADFFLRVEDGIDVDAQIDRFVRLVFGHPYATPTRDEYGMFQAKAAALRSADLSRQVGAVVLREDGGIVASGCNEVPKAGGGAFWEGDESEEDNRDWKLGYDVTARKKEDNLAQVFNRLKERGWLADGVEGRAGEDLAREALYGEEAFLKDAGVANIIEYGRIVHAEMAALTEAARHGLGVAGTTLYCTTFPCHMCARHVIASGIRRVVYVEPYPKSLAKELYPASISVEGDPAAEGAVRFEPFIGVAPSRYVDFFEYRKRKDERGRVIEWSLKGARPRLSESFVTYPEVEAVYVLRLASSAARAAIFGSGEGASLEWLLAELGRAESLSATWTEWKRQALELQASR